ncbi:acyltransferase [Demequina sp. NBRC 110056]|uniref:acyltransferase family protein n=1 Tax=Demequina sp. NBRC 110056 TaxID=1570345 RepID=UPI000A0500DF|nr:acyltransferase [Demequina sp. NBRC 110056]
MAASATSASGTTVPPRTFRPDIQGLRALAVLLVMAQHLGIPTGAGGFVGVDVFLVISGFLITGFIVERLAAGTFNFGDFYARRVRRLLPASLLTVLLTLIAAALFLPPALAQATAQDATASALYLPNVFWTWEWWNGIFSERRAFGHFWSLGLEEQFYLLWPLLLVAAFALGRRSRLAFTVGIAVVFVGSFVTSVVMTPGDPIAAYYLLHTRAWEFALGGLVWMAVAQLRAPGPDAPRSSPSRAPVYASLAVLGLALVAVGYVVCRALPFPGWSAMLPAGGAALVIMGGAIAPSGLGTRLLSLRPAVWLGTISYSLYLIHLPMVVIPQLANGEPLWGPWRVLIGAAAVPLAWLMWRYIEQPFRIARGHVAGGWKTVAVGVVASLAVAGVSWLSGGAIFVR